MLKVEAKGEVQVGDMIEDLEHKLGKSEEFLNDSRMQTENNERELKALEKLVEEQVEEINILSDKSHSMVAQISENMRMENKIIVKNKVILGEFTMVSQPIRLILVDWFVFNFCLGCFLFFFLLFF